MAAAGSECEGSLLAGREALGADGQLPLLWQKTNRANTASINPNTNASTGRELCRGLFGFRLILLLWKHPNAVCPLVQLIELLDRICGRGRVKPLPGYNVLRKHSVIRYTRSKGAFVLHTVHRASAPHCCEAQSRCL